MDSPSDRRGRELQVVAIIYGLNRNLCSHFNTWEREPKGGDRHRYKDSGSSRDVLHGVSVVGVSDSVCARAPGIEQVAEVCAIDIAVGVDVACTSRRPSRARPPSVEHNAEVCAIDYAISVKTRWALRALRFNYDGVEVAARDA